MAGKLPRFMPILMSFAARVAGRNIMELLSSSAALARTLSETQKVVGHDGVLCAFEPSLLGQSCVVTSGGTAKFRAPNDLPCAGSMAVLFEAVRALGLQVSPDVSVFAAFAGPALLHAYLSERCPGASEVADFDYAGDVFTSAVRAGCEAGAHGIAVIEQLPADASREIPPLYRSARKLADFYERLFVVFLTPGSQGADLHGPPHCTFALPPSNDACSAVAAMSFDTSLASQPPLTTAGDVPADTPVERIRSLWKAASRSF